MAKARLWVGVVLAIGCAYVSERQGASLTMATEMYFDCMRRNPGRAIACSEYEMNSYLSNQASWTNILLVALIPAAILWLVVWVIARRKKLAGSKAEFPTMDRR